jgi:hypothetical protein
MTDVKTLDQAKVAIGKILSALDIVKVVFVDDENAAEPALEETLVAVATLASEELGALVPEFGSSVPDDEEIRKNEFRRFWSDWDPEVRRTRSEQILSDVRLKHGGGQDDIADAAILHGLLPRDALLSLTPNQWDQRKADLLRENTGCRTLFLFDQDLSKGGGDIEGGIKAIASLLASDQSGAIICGLLTHTVQPESQLDCWEQLSRAHSIPKDRFLVVSKQLLNRDPVVFAHMLKLVALCPDFAAMKERTRDVIIKASESAAKRIETISIHDLNHIVFRVSADEGLWEPDMLFHLHSLFHRLEARRLAHEGGELETISKRLRSVSHIATDTKHLRLSSTWQIQREELYEGGEHLSANHLPIELGDIFRKTGGNSEKRYILLAQPCDLMVRASGRREPELEYVTLAEVARSAGTSPYVREMEYYGEDPDDRWFVKLRQTHYVPCCILDLCVFDSNGQAAVTVGAVEPTGLRPAWEARFGRLQKHYACLQRRLNAVLSPIQDVELPKEEIMSGFFRELFPKGPFKASLSKENACLTIAYNCQRVGRLSRARAVDLLMAYTSCLSRPAFECSFGKPVACGDCRS